jgi:hypothetical protein
MTMRVVDKRRHSPRIVRFSAGYPQPRSGGWVFATQGTKRPQEVTKPQARGLGFVLLL